MITFLIASNSSTSINRQISEWVKSKGITPDHTIDLIERAQVPLYGIDIEKSNGIPNDIQEDAKALAASHTVVIFSPEHNSIVPAVLKNYMDWLSRHVRLYLEDTQVVVVTTSPGRGGGARSATYLETVLPYVGANVAGTLSLPSFGQRKESGELMTPDEFQKFEEFVACACL